MKKLILSILFIICLSFQASAWNPMALLTGSGCGNPSWYADAIISWNGDHCSGTNYWVETDGDSVAAVNTALTISRAYGENSSNGAYITDGDQYLTVTNGANVYLDPDASQTIWMRVYMNDTPDGAFPYFEAYYNADNRLRIGTQASLLQFSNFTWSTVQYDTYGTVAESTGTWVDIAVSWDNVRPDGNFSIYSGGQWDEDLNDIDDTDGMDGDITWFCIGVNNWWAAGPGVGNEIRVTQVAIVSGYLQDAPWW